MAQFGAVSVLVSVDVDVDCSAIWVIVGMISFTSANLKLISPSLNAAGFSLSIAVRAWFTE